MFYGDGPDSGTLRVKVLTFSKPHNADVSGSAVLQLVLEAIGKKESDAVEVGRNALVRYEESALERGTRLRIFYWVFCNPVSSGNARVVTFSYTVLETQADTSQTRQELEMLNASLLETEFSERIGI